MKHIAPRIALAAASAVAMPRAILGPTIRADATDPKVILATLAKEWEEFKAENDTALKAKADDVVTKDKVDKINAEVTKLQKALDDVAVKLAAAEMGAGAKPVKSAEEQEYDKQFMAFFRHGDHERELRAAQKLGPRAAMSVGSNPDGGYLAPVEWDRTLTGKLKLVSPIRQEATVQQISTAGFRKLFTDRNVGSGWVGETAARPATSTPQVTPLDFNTGELYAFPFASQQLLEDAQVDVEKWLADEVETEFGRQEGIGFLSGDGVNKPYGLLTYITGGANAGRHPWGAITTVASGAAALIGSDGIISIMYDLPQAWSANAKFYMNRLTAAGIRKLKDGQGNYLWQPSYAAGQPATLAGTSIVDTPDLPNVGAGATPILYGDMKETYLVVDRLGINVLRDALTNKPFVGFYTRKRVGGGVKNVQSMRALVIAAN